MITMKSKILKESKLNFNKLMLLNNYNVSSLSKASNVPIMTISDLKNNKSSFDRINVKTALKISKAFNTSIEDIYNQLYDN